MKLIKKLINKGRLFTEVVCIGILFSFCANSAQVNVIVPNPVVRVNPGNYVYNNIYWHDERGTRLNADTLRYHLLNVKDDADGTRAYAIASARAHARAFFRARTRPYTRARTSHLSFVRNHALACVRACIRELSRMLLAQIPATGRIRLVGPHNVAGNNNSNYTVAPKAEGNGRNCDDIFLACDALKNHLLEHGHLGYFPMISVQNENSQVKVNKLIPRGIFNIPFNVASRIANHHNLTTDTLHLSPNILAGTELPAMFAVDPERRGWPAHPNLESVANGLINHLLSTGSIEDVQIGAVDRNRFTLDVTYNFPNPIPDTTQTKDIGYNLNGDLTNTVKIVVQVQNGIISIVTMYPI